MRKVLPLTLILSLAAFGCSMNRTPGNGQPFSATPSMSPATTPGTSYGNVPMASSYTVPTTNTRLSADDAATIMREHQAYKGRFLGYLNPTPVTTSAPATVIRGTLAATGFGTLTPMVIPASTPSGSPITVSNSDGQIVVSNVRSQ